MQLSYSSDMSAGFPGQLAGIAPPRTMSKAALEPIGFGLAVVQSQADSDKCRLPMCNQVVLTITTHDLEASNSTVGKVTVTSIVDGVRIEVETTLTATVYATSHAATLAAIATKIAAVDGIASATADGTNDLITVVADPDVDVELSDFVTTLGSNQGTWTYTRSSTDKVIGVSLHTHALEMDAANEAIYPLNKAVSVLRAGSVNVKAEASSGPSAGGSVYVRFRDGGAGKPVGGFRKDADTDKAMLVSAAVFPSAIASAAVGAVDFNLP